MELTAKRTKTNKMTALQTLIQQLEIIKKECEIQAKYFNKNDMQLSLISSSAMAYSYGIAIEKAKELLETEKQKIVDAYNSKFEKLKQEFLPDNGGIETIYRDGIQYYNQLINKEK